MNKINNKICMLCNAQTPHLLNHLKEVHGANLKTAITGYVFRCDLCDIECTGPEVWRTHVVGAKHKRELARQNSVGTVSQYFCSTCEIECTGPESYYAHVEGKVHLKRVQKLLLDEQIRDQGLFRKEELIVKSGSDYSLFSDDAVLSPEVPKISESHYCNTCEEYLPTLEVMYTHFNSIPHAQRVLGTDLNGDLYEERDSTLSLNERKFRTWFFRVYEGEPSYDFDRIDGNVAWVCSIRLPAVTINNVPFATKTYRTVGCDQAEAKENLLSVICGALSGANLLFVDSARSPVLNKSGK